MFQQSELSFQPGLYSNRSKRASKGRWVDGNLVRFRDGVPAQMGGWVQSPVDGSAISGRPRDWLAWRPNNLSARLSAIGTHLGVFKFDGGSVTDISPVGIIPGRADSIIGSGFGAGLYGDEFYGTERTSSANLLDATVWTFDMFGEILLGCFSANGTLYEYLDGSTTKMVPVTNAPMARAMCVSDERHVFAFGCDGNPNLVRWSDRENRNVWAPLATNRAGSYDLQATSPLQCGKRVGGQILAWTQTEVFGLAPLSNSLVYSRDRLASECGAMGPHAACVVTDQGGGGSAYWMGSHSFFVFDGLVRKLPCELQDFVFKDINILQRVKCQARANTAYDEVWFFYCSAASTEIDRAVVYNYANATWTKALISRLTWLDAGIFPRPLAITEAGTIYEHENGSMAGTVRMPSFVRSHPIMVGVGQQLAEISDFWPDMEEGSGTCELTMFCRDYSGGPETPVGPFEFTPAVEKVDLSISTRQAQLQIAGKVGPWELGVPVLNVQSGGGR
ncbi:hypothetical protein D3Y57_07065 [Sphingomonas paeninsulae]|uniref:Uncharacterized protein n=1 Tax=Sphingomonas paeninsulae TaxID=2319844 RepID=A0A494TK22_SPHPE|nr:hypothetical protein [Sphingomonas paeninsulae]AYJ85778.1 hypothetical protein D3Y57_07065 [Sphingomonas paeninsulae]